MGRNKTVMIDTKTGRERVFYSFRCPLISMMVEGESEKVFIDSRAPFSIYNPPREERASEKSTEERASEKSTEERASEK
jgi:hypothetical protein